MKSKNVAVFGIYPSRADVLDAVEALKNAGFRNADVAVLVPDNPGTKDFALQKNSKAPEGATIGGIAGGTIGGLLGWLAAIAVVTVPGLAGPIMGTLGGITVGGAIGGLLGALIGFGIPEYEAKRFEGRVRKGGILLSVHCDAVDWSKRAKSVLSQTGAEDISLTREAKAEFAATDRPMKRVAYAPVDVRETDPALPAKAGTSRNSF